MKKVLFLVAHPHLAHSRVNRAVVEAVEGIENLTLHCLYDLYPYFHIDVAREKELLLKHDMIVVQHPFYWYSMPPLMKLWLDEVLEFGWAYGEGGTKLQGKEFQVSLSTGGTQEAYSPEGYNRFSMEQLLAPWNQTVHLCGMKWKEPIVFHRSLKASDREINNHALFLRLEMIAATREGRTN